MIDFVIGNDNFAKNLAESLNCDYREFKEEYYSDGEPCPRILANYEEIEGKHVAVVVRLKFPATFSDIAVYLHNFLRVISNLSDRELFNAKHVDAIFPYFVLGRQDHNPKTDPSQLVRNRDKGKDIGYKTLIKMFKGCGTNRIVTFNPHFHVLEGNLKILDLDVVSLSGIRVLGEYFSPKLDGDAVVVGRDEKAGRLAEQLAKQLNLKSYYFEKKRINEKEVKYKGKFDAKDQDVLIIDDLTTGMGIASFLEKIVNLGNVYFGVIHATLALEGYRILKNLLRRGEIKDFATTNTTISPFSKINIIPELIKFYAGKLNI